MDFGHYHLTVGYHLKVGCANANAKAMLRQGLRNAKGKAVANSASFGFWIKINFPLGV